MNVYDTSNRLSSSIQNGSTMIDNDISTVGFLWHDIYINRGLNIVLYSEGVYKYQRSHHREKQRLGQKVGEFYNLDG